MGETSNGAESGSGPHIVTLLGILVAIVVAAALKIAAGILIPLVLAVFLVYLLAPVMAWLSRRGVPEALTLPVTIILLVGFAVVLQVFVSLTVAEISARAPFYSERFERLAERVLEAVGGNAHAFQEVDWVGQVSGAVSALTVGIFGSVISFVGNLVLVTAYVIFLLLGRKSIAQNLARAFDPDRAAEIRTVLGQVNQQVQQYIATKIVLSAITGGLMYAVLMIFGVDFALFFGLLGFLLNFIPTVGSAIAATLPILLSILQFDEAITVIGVALSLIAIQQIIGNAIEPKVMGERLNMSPIVVLFSLVFFGWLWGFWGMVLSVPLMATLKIAMSHSKSLKPFAVMLEK